MGRRFLMTFAASTYLFACSASETDGDLPVPPASAPPTQRETSPLAVLDLGEVPAKRETPFEVPDGTLGFALVASAQPSTSVVVLRDPLGAVVEDGTLVGCTEPTDKLLAGPVHTVQVPARGRLLGADVLPKGTWSLTLSDTARVRVVAQRTPDGRFHGGLLDVHVYLPEGLLVDRESTSSGALPSGIRRRLAQLDAFSRKLYGVELGTVTPHAISARFRHIAGTPEASSYDATAALYRETSMIAPSQALHLFFVESSDAYWGHAGGIPGAVLTTGAETSGVALALTPSPSAEEDESAAELDASAIAHEIGHFVGLSHTTILPGRTDCLDDTPTCDDTTPARRDACPDRSNLMFFAGGGRVASTVLSPKQRRVFHGSPLFRAFPTDE